MTTMNSVIFIHLFLQLSAFLPEVLASTLHAQREVQPALVYIFFKIDIIITSSHFCFQLVKIFLLEEKSGPTTDV